MRVRFTVMARRPTVTSRRDQGRWIREAGARPARTRHCDRGCRTRAASSRSHWTATCGPGRRGAVGPGSQETSLRPRKPRSPRGKGWLTPCASSSPAWLAGLVAARSRRRAGAAPANVDGARRRARRDTLVPRTARATSRPAAVRPSDGDRRPCSAHERAAARSTPRRRGDWAGHAATRASATTWSTRSRARRTTFSRRSRHVLGVLDQLHVRAALGVCGEQMQEGDDVLLFPSCYGGARREPTPLRLSVGAGSAPPGQAVDVRVGAVRVDVRRRANADHGAGRRRDGERGGPPPPTGADGTRRS